MSSWACCLVFYEDYPQPGLEKVDYRPLLLVTLSYPSQASHRLRPLLSGPSVLLAFYPTNEGLDNRVWRHG